MNKDEVDFANFYHHDSSLKKIRFTFLGYSIDGSKYERLWYHLLGRKVTVNRRVSDAGFDASGASYFMVSDSFSLGSTFAVGSTYGKAMLAHEGAHALVDLQNLGPIDRGISEGIAYLAEALWLTHAGFNPIAARKGSRTANAKGLEPMRDKAYAIAGALAGGNGQVPEPAARDLVKAVVSDPLYTDPRPHVSNGIGGATS